MFDDLMHNSRSVTEGIKLHLTHDTNFTSVLAYAIGPVLRDQRNSKMLIIGDSYNTVTITLYWKSRFHNVKQC